MALIESQYPHSYWRSNLVMRQSIMNTYVMIVKNLKHVKTLMSILRAWWINRQISAKVRSRPRPPAKPMSAAGFASEEDWLVNPLLTNTWTCWLKPWCLIKTAINSLVITKQISILIIILEGSKCANWNSNMFQTEQARVYYQGMHM